MKVEEMREIVAEVLEMENDPELWTITDTLEIPGTDEVRLVMVNAVPGSELEGDLRGLMVDLRNKMVYGGSRGMVDTFVFDQLPIEDGQLVLGEETFPVDQVNFQPIFDGVVIRVLLVDNQIVLATHKKFNPDRSHWDKSRTFLELFEALQIPIEELFSEEASFSPVVHSFLVSDPALWVASKYRGSLFAVYLGPSLTWSVETNPYPIYEVDPEIREPANMVTEVQLNNTQPYLYSPTVSMSVDEANQHLLWSWESPRRADMDPRQLPGGGLMVYLPDGGLIKVMSPAWDWREQLRLNTSNLTNAVYKAKDSIREGSYEEMFPTLIHRSMKDLLIQAGNIVTWDNVDSPATTPGQMVSNMLNNYVLAAPWHRQSEILRLRREMNTDIAMLGNFILSFLPTQPQKSYKGRGKQQLDWKQKIKVRLEGYPDQVVERIISILGFVMASTRDVNPQELEIARRTQVKAALDRESGASLYRLVKAMKKFRGQ